MNNKLKMFQKILLYFVILIMIIPNIYANQSECICGIFFVKTYNDNTTLRLKNVNTDYSDNFKDAIVNNSKPVVLSRGTHSNLLTWNKFGQELAFDEKSARDTWLIEIVGGPTIDEECSPNGQYNCPNYTFSDLKVFYWPALITGVQNYSAQKTLDYVGYSLGCSAALESLKLYGSSGKTNAGYIFDSTGGNYLPADLSSNPIDTFVAVACPGNFSQLPTFMEIFNMTYNNVFDSSALSHIQGGEIRKATTSARFKVLSKDPVLYLRPNWNLIYLSGFIDAGDHRISKNIYQEYYNWVNNETGPKFGEGVSLNNLLVIQGKTTLLSAIFSSGIQIPSDIDTASDLIVPNQDSKDLCSNINSGNKYYASFRGKTHGGITTTVADQPEVKKQIKDFLRDKSLSDDGSFEFNTNCDTI